MSAGRLGEAVGLLWARRGGSETEARYVSVTLQATEADGERGQRMGAWGRSGGEGHEFRISHGSMSV